MRKIQIDYDMFLNTYKLVTALNDYDLNNDIKKLCNALEGQINVKIDAIKKHNVYTQSKIGATVEEKEKARQEYLDLAGIHKDWRYNADSVNKS